MICGQYSKSRTLVPDLSCIDKFPEYQLGETAPADGASLPGFREMWTDRGTFTVNIAKTRLFDGLPSLAL